MIRPGIASVSLVAAAEILTAGACHEHETASREALKVAAAADLAFAFRDIGSLYEKATGQRVIFSFGSTGLLEEQISQGAPFDVFAAASVAFADDAIASGACKADSKSLYATGRIVLFPGQGTVRAPTAIADLADERIAKIAIANPAHAPYGRAAKQALERAGVWGRVSSKIVYGENVQQALQFAQSGNADVAIVALSLATATSEAWVTIPSELHDPIDQALVVCEHGNAGATAGRRFVAFVGSAAGRAVMQRYGFLLPGESMGVPK
jgi:molybdate transport system substrate-binding protein